MRIICDINIFYGVSYELLNKISEIHTLVVTKVAINEILSTEGWKNSKYERVLKTLKKSKHVAQSGSNYFLLQPEDILLTKSGITSLPPKPSEIYTSDKINSLLDANDSLHSQAIEMMKNNSGSNDYETLFADAFKEMIDRIDSIDEIYSEKLNGTNFHMLHPDLKTILINTVLHYFSLRVNKYITIVHERNPVFYIPQGIKLRNDEVVVQTYAAYLYHRIRELPAKNDQFDLQYMFYLNEGDKIWTSDNLLITLLKNELNRANLLFNPESCI